MSLAEKVLPSESSVWRGRFRDLYDISHGYSSTELKIEYQTRSIVLSQKITFRYGENDEQTLWLEVMQTMLLESFSLLGVNGKSSTSKNFEYLCGVLSRSDFLNRPVSGYGETNPRAPSELFCAVQLVSNGHRCCLFVNSDGKQFKLNRKSTVSNGPSPGPIHVLSLPTNRLRHQKRLLL